MRAGVPILILPLMAVLAGGSAFAQAPPPPKAKEVLKFARRHAAERMVEILQKRMIAKGWPLEGKTPAEYLLETGLRADLLDWLEGPRFEGGPRKTFSDRTVEILLQVRFDEVTRFLRASASRRRLRLMPRAAASFSDLGDRDHTYAQATGVGIPVGVAWALRRVKPDPSWVKMNPMAEHEVNKAAYQDARKNLYTAVKTLRVGEKRTVGEFLSAIDFKDTNFTRFVDENYDDGPYPIRYLPKGRCEVDLFLHLVELHYWLSAIARQPAARGSLREVSLEHLVSSNGGRRVLMRMGAGIHKVVLKNVPNWIGIELKEEAEAALPVNAPSEEAARDQARLEARKKAHARLLEKILDLPHPSGPSLRKLAFTPERLDRLRELVEGHRGKGHPGENRLYSWRVKIPLDEVWKLVKDWR